MIGQDFLQIYGVLLDFDIRKFVITPHINLVAAETCRLPAGYQVRISAQASIPVHDGVVALVGVNSQKKYPMGILYF